MTLLQTGRTLLGLDTRGPLLAQLAALEREAAVASAERARAIAAAQAEVDALEEPRKRLTRLKDADLAASRREGEAISKIENQLMPPAAVGGLEQRIRRVLEALRDGPNVTYEPGFGGGPDRITNLEDLERHRDALALAVRLRARLRQRATLRLPTPDLIEALEEMGRELDEATLGTDAERV